MLLSLLFIHSTLSAGAGFEAPQGLKTFENGYELPLSGNLGASKVGGVISFPRNALKGAVLLLTQIKKTGAGQFEFTSEQAPGTEKLATSLRDEGIAALVLTSGKMTEEEGKNALHGFTKWEASLSGHSLPNEPSNAEHAQAETAKPAPADKNGPADEQAPGGNPLMGGMADQLKAAVLLGQMATGRSQQFNTRELPGKTVIVCAGAATAACDDLTEKERDLFRAVLVVREKGKTGKKLFFTPPSRLTQKLLSFY